MAKTKVKDGLSLREVAPHEWVFDGGELNDRDTDRFHAALDRLDGGADPASVLAELEALLRQHPGHIDVRHHVALLLQLLDRDDEAFAHWTTAVGMGMSVLPPSFYFGLDRLEWGWLENRPFLRACHGLAMALRAESVLGEAFALLANILDLNPNDNQGVRMLLVACCFDMRRPVDVLRICDRYPGDGPDLQFGKALALFQLGRHDEAEAAYREGAQFWPRVHEELLKTRHTRPKSKHPGFITVGGADEAYAYWEEYGPHWKTTKGALAMAKRVTSGPIALPMGAFSKQVVNDHFDA